MTGQDAAEGRRAGHSRLFVKKGKIVKEIPDQDAAKRARDEWLLFNYGHIHGPFSIARNDLEFLIDAAVAEAVKERDAEIARLRQLVKLDAGTIVLREREVAEARREERERISDEYHDALQNGLDAGAAFSVACRPPAGAPEGTGGGK